MTTRVLLFVGSDEEGVRVRLLLAAFGVRAARVGAAMPLNARHHALLEFNRGVYDYLIATDAGGEGGAAAAPGTPAKAAAAPGRRAKGAAKGAKPSPITLADPEFGVARGVDFQGVRTVLNFDAPLSPEHYTHRAGRAGRAGAPGDVITFFGGAGLTEAALAAALAAAAGPGAAPPPALAPYPRLPPTAAAALRYRCDDVARTLTKGAVREAAAQELRRELLNSTRLAAHFAAKPGDLALLRHDAPLTAAGRAAAAGGGGPNGGKLGRLPSYVLAAAGAAAAAGAPHVRAGSASKKRKAPSSADPLRGGAVGFARAPRRGDDAGDGPTELEARAAALGRRDAKKAAKAAGPALVPKRNVRKGKQRRR